VSHIREKQLIVGQEFFTVEFAPLILRKHSVLLAFDILSLDIDRNTSWIGRALRALREFRPQIAVIEYNASIPQKMTGAEWLIAADAWFSDLPPTH
jgi:HAMP domain-containing protein